MHKDFIEDTKVIVFCNPEIIVLYVLIHTGEIVTQDSSKSRCIDNKAGSKNTNLKI